MNRLRPAWDGNWYDTSTGFVGSREAVEAVIAGSTPLGARIHEFFVKDGWVCPICSSPWGHTVEDGVR